MPQLPVGVAVLLVQVRHYQQHILQNDICTLTSTSSIYHFIYFNLVQNPIHTLYSKLFLYLISRPTALCALYVLNHLIIVPDPMGTRYY